MTEAYKEKIVQAFRDNAIRSVLLIDDEYLPYEKLYDTSSSLSSKLSELEKVTDLHSVEYKNIIQEALSLNQPLLRSKVAKDFIGFFHEGQRICSVESNVNNLDFEKIRKSDLIVLDYHLNPEDKGNEANSSLTLISELSKNRHMNIVVVYTNEDLKKVWNQIAAVLHGNNIEPSELKGEELEAWQSHQINWEEAWKNNVFKQTMIFDYLVGSLELAPLKEQLQLCFSDEEETDLLQLCHVKKLLEDSISKFNLINSSFSGFKVHGTREKWLQAGHVFVALKPKIDSDRPTDIWKCIEDSLHDWNPCFYRLVISELQNKIEDANLAMEKAISSSEKDQMAFLWGILQVADKDKHRVSRELLGNIANEALDRILYESAFISEIVNTAKLTSSESMVYVERNPRDEAPYKEFQKRILRISAENVSKVKVISSQQEYEIAHAYNEKLSTTKHFPNYFTTGSILRDEHSTWYVCVTPSCNTVPRQETDDAIRKLKPHRSLTLAKLKKIDNFEDALKNAHHSSYIFVTSPEGDALTFSVINLETKLPDLIKVIICDHDKEEWENGSYKEFVTFKTTFCKQTQKYEIKQNIKKCYPVALLKPAYAARYQNIQSHYEGRIGVDFVTLDLS